MTVRAGIDVGNSTTEVVLARTAGLEIDIVAAGRAPTRRAKGSPESLAAAAALVRRLERRHDLRVDEAAVAPLRPVESRAASLPEARADTGRLTVVAAGSATVGGVGFGVGRPVPWTDLETTSVGEKGRSPVSKPPDRHDRVVMVVPAGVGFRAALAGLQPLAYDGRLAGVLLADDEAVLVANRLDGSVPVVDGVDPDAALQCRLVAVEVAEPGRPLRALADPLRLISAFGLESGAASEGAAAAAVLADVSNAVLGLLPERATSVEPEHGWVDLRDGTRCRLVAGEPVPGQDRVGAVAAYRLPGDRADVSVDDLFALDLAAVAATVQARRPAAAARPLGLAGQRTGSTVDPADRLADDLGLPVTTVGSEAASARTGALSTPGATSDSVVVDLGGGTIDLVTPRESVVAAGAGDLLTQSVAALSGVTPAAAEWVKRGPAQRVEAPQVLLGEDGERTFLDDPVGADAVGRLVVTGPAGMLPFTDRMAPGEWRALRLALKSACLGGNVARALASLEHPGEAATPLLVVGGPVGDDEVLTALTRVLPRGSVVARGNVGGQLGHRYAVAYGLVRHDP